MQVANTKIFSIYRSSAGSGKTRTLAKEYLKLALRYRANYFKHILAVTFTNKSTQEMKQRILKYLNDFANGISNDLGDELKEELNLDNNTLQQYSQEVQREILHNYSHFAISTIDSFFQKVIRSFTREAGIMGDYTLEMDQEKVIDEVIDQLIDEMGSNESLSKWIIQFTEENLEEGKSWDVRHGLKEFTKEIFKEDFKRIEQELIEKTSEENYFQNLIRDLQKQRAVFINTISKLAKEAISLIHEKGFAKEDFKWGGGAYKFLFDLQSLDAVSTLATLAVRPQREYLEAKHWPAPKHNLADAIEQLAADKLVPLLNEILAFREKNLEVSLSAEMVLKNFYAFGLIADISRKLSAYKKQNNLMLIADAPALLSGLIQDSDTPFIYEKVGSFYRNFLIDEFQDTSLLQWSNFYPLVKNSLDQGYPGMVVGDVKQSIYRWRGGDLNLLQQGLQQQFGADRVATQNLATNYRSAATLVDFNNQFFAAAADLVKQVSGSNFIQQAFEDVAQQVYHKTKPGYVEAKFFIAKRGNRTYTSEEEEEENEHWKAQALVYMTQQIETLQASGAHPKDIAILVRTGKEGKEVAAHLLQHKASTEAKANCNYEVISNDSLLLSGAASVNLICAAMRMLWRWNDAMARAQLAFEYQRLFRPALPATDLMVKNQADFEAALPAAFVKEAAALRKMPLYEMAESLLKIFELHNIQGELTYQFSFLDLLLDFSKRERNDLHSFLQWWEENKEKKSIELSDGLSAMRILTVHSAKGLQFPYVILPFCTWSLDHDGKKGPMLWVKSDEGIFKDKGYFPVQYASAMEQSYFKDFYVEERVRAYLDNLNLLYVAFTRAEAGMFIISNVGEKLEVKQEPANMAQLLFAILKENQVWQTHWHEDELCMRLGELKIAEQKTDAQQNELQLTQFSTGSWQDKMQIKQAAKNFYDAAHKARLEKIQYGIKVHEVLARIVQEQDLPRALNDVLAEGLITQEEAARIEAQLQKLFATPLVADWFSEKWQARNEAGILLPGMQELRVDKLLTREKQAIILDYKTGEKKAADKEQVNDYMQAMRNMGYAVKGYLLYLGDEDIAIEEVKFAAGKGDKDQLSLNL